MRFFDGKCFCEELLALIALENFTTGEVISDKIKLFFTENGLDLTKICLLVTDGAPAMLGKHQGVTARLSAVAPQMQLLHCLIHQCSVQQTEQRDERNNGYGDANNKFHSILVKSAAQVISAITRTNGSRLQRLTS